jgi:hypothetical protein
MSFYHTYLAPGSPTGSVGMEKMSDDGKEELLSQIFGDVGDLVDGQYLL